MAFNFDIIYLKRELITPVGALPRLEFSYEQIENHENAKDKILYKV